MIQISASMRIFLAVQPADFRKGIDGLAALCRQKLKEEPFSGALFVFRNKRGTAVKLLCYDGQGFWLCYKRMSQGRFRWWPQEEGETTQTLTPYQLQHLLWGGDPTAVAGGNLWRGL